MTSGDSKAARLRFKADIRRLYAAGVSVVNIAAAMGLKPSSIYRHIDASSGGRRAAANKRRAGIEPGWLADGRLLLSSGMSRHAIAKRLGFSLTSVYKWLGPAGAPRNQWAGAGELQKRPS